MASLMVMANKAMGKICGEENDSLSDRQTLTHTNDKWKFNLN